MNSSIPRGDLSEYVAVVWASRNVILLGTAGCVVVMAALTWAAPRLYVVRSEIDAGVLAQLQPVETNLLVEAVDRSQFTVEGGLFPETMPKGLTVTWRPPSTMILEAKSTDPVGAVQRLQVLVAAVAAELETRLRRYALQRASAAGRTDTFSDDAMTRLSHLTQLMEERSTAAPATSVVQDHADAVKAASERSSFQLAAAARHGQRLRRLRDLLMKQSDVDPALIASVRALLETLVPDDDPAEPENVFFALEREQLRNNALKRLSASNDPVLAELSDVVRQVAAYDIRVARSLERQRAAGLALSAEQLRQRDERGLSLVGSASSVGSAAAATSLERSLGDLEQTYKDDPPMARAVRATKAIFGDLANVYRDAEGNNLPGLTRTPRVLVAPTLPQSPIWPRPAVNLAVAFLFGLAGSTLFAVFASRLRAEDVS